MPIGASSASDNPVSDESLRDEWYYCLDHKLVETEHGCRDAVRIGPFPTREEAEHALERVQQRNDTWDNDPDWNDPDSDSN